MYSLHTDFIKSSYLLNSFYYYLSPNEKYIHPNIRNLTNDLIYIIYLSAPFTFPIKNTNTKLIINTITAIIGIENAGLKLVDLKLNKSNNCIAKSCIK